MTQIYPIFNSMRQHYKFPLLVWLTSVLVGPKLMDSIDFYIKDLKARDQIAFKREHIIQYYTLDELDIEDPLSKMINKFSKKCFVSNHIMKEGY